MTANAHVYVLGFSHTHHVSTIHVQVNCLIYHSVVLCLSYLLSLTLGLVHKRCLHSALKTIASNQSSLQEESLSFIWDSLLPQHHQNSLVAALNP